MPACPSLVCSFNRGNIKGTDFIYFLSTYVCFVLFAQGLVLWIDLRKGLYDIRRVLKNEFAYDRV